MLILRYLKSEKSSNTNTRNGHSSKQSKTVDGEFSIEFPRDREGSFEPIVVPKRKTIADGIDNVIISCFPRFSCNTLYTPCKH